MKASGLRGRVSASQEKKPLARAKGFTLVELMIVVAIIGILSSIAVPNYQKYQAKARTSEAKVVLSGMYTAEKTFAVDYTSYTTCLQTIGGAPEGTQVGGVNGLNKNRVYYTTGFGAAFAACGTGGTACSALTLITNNSAFADCASAEGETFFTATAGQGNITTVADLKGTNAAATAFTIGAVGYVLKSAANAYDTWEINENKVLKQTQFGF